MTQVKTLSPFIEGYLIFFNFLKNFQINQPIYETELFKKLEAEIEVLHKNSSINFGRFLFRSITVIDRSLTIIG